LLPESPPFYDKDALTDRPEKFFVSEIIREKILLNYKKEIPYSCEVEVESFKEEPEIVRIRAVIMVIRDSQKGILIGHQGKGLKRVGTEARKDMEQFLNKKVFLELYVKVNKDWRNNESQLKRFGYLNR
ncbi:MAG: GTPase Era, partial [Vicingaceae bacterium]|nr:GTPase Era [Vicingaceae bacterium]